MPPHLLKTSTAKLAFNNLVYERLRREVDRRHRRNDPELLRLIEATARFAWASHPGRFADGALENVLLEIGQELTDLPAPDEAKPPASSNSRTLHVASELFTTGGHSRTLAKWVQRDLSSSHAVVVTRQPGDLPAYLVTIADERRAPIIVLNRGESRIDRARRLRTMARNFDRVILHHHPDDCVPVLAFAAPGGSPVAMFNHAHFWFSLGPGVSDVVINTMPYFKALTERYRFPRATDLLDGPPGIQPMRWREVDKRRAKALLGLPTEAPVAVTIGAHKYFEPSGDVSFFGTLAKLLTARPDLHVLAVGVPEDSPLVPRGIRETGRVRLVGPVADPCPYYEAADVCLESFPMPSLGALTEAVAFGQAFPVFAYAADESPTRVTQQRIAAVAKRQPTEAAYLRHICDLLDAPGQIAAHAAELRRTLIDDDERFGAQFPSMYERLNRLKHTPRELPRTDCSVNAETLTLASMPNIGPVGDVFDLLPMHGALSVYLGSVLRRYESPASAAKVLARRLARPIISNLPEGVRRRLRHARDRARVGRLAKAMVFTIPRWAKVGRSSE